MRSLAPRIATLGAGLFLCVAPALPAVAAAPDPAPPAAVAAPDPADDRQVPQLTAATSVRAVAAEEEFRLHGSAASLPAGTEVTLQQRQKKAWVTLPATVRVKADHTYSMRVALGMKGRNELRVVACTPAKPEVPATVRSAPVCTASQPVAVLVR